MLNLSKISVFEPMIRTPQISVGTVIVRPALVHLSEGLTPLKVASPLEKVQINKNGVILGHRIFAVAGDITGTGVAPKRFSDTRPGWRALQDEVVNPKRGSALGARVYLPSNLPANWTAIRVINVIKHRWDEEVNGEMIKKSFSEYRGVITSDPSAFVNYYREAYLADMGAEGSNMSNDFQKEMDFVFDEGEIRKKLMGETAPAV